MRASHQVLNTADQRGMNTFKNFTRVESLLQCSDDGDFWQHFTQRDPAVTGTFMAPPSALAPTIFICIVMNALLLVSSTKASSATKSRRHTSWSEL
jgi:hypothetical protein